MTTNNPHSDNAAAQSAHPIRDFVREMQREFGKCEYKATSSDGTVVQSAGWGSVAHPTKEMGDSLVHKVL